MIKQKTTKLIHEGEYLAEVSIEVEVNDDPWAPYMTVGEAEKLDTVRRALIRGDLQQASEYARVYKLTPVRP